MNTPDHDLTPSPPSEVTSLFEASAPEFMEYGRQVRGYIRYRVTQLNVQQYLGSASMNVLDVYGGSGFDTAWLAQDGHRVTLVETDPLQLQYAEQRFGDELSAEARQRITRITQPDEAMATLRQEKQFDMILCHGVAMYQPEPPAFVTNLGPLLKPHGIMSIMEKGYKGALRRAKRQSLPQEAVYKLRQTRRTTNNLGMDVYAFRAQELYDLLHGAGLEVLSWSGVRIKAVDDKRSIKDVPPQELADIIKEERALGHNLEHRSKGEMLHFIARQS